MTLDRRLTRLLPLLIALSASPALAQPVAQPGAQPAAAGSSARGPPGARLRPCSRRHRRPRIDVTRRLAVRARRPCRDAPFQPRQRARRSAGLRTDQLRAAAGPGIRRHRVSAAPRRFALGSARRCSGTSGSKAPDPRTTPRPPIRRSRRVSTRWCRSCRRTSAAGAVGLLGGGYAFMRRATATPTPTPGRAR